MVVSVRFAALAVALCALLAVPTVAGAATPKPKTGKSVVVKRVKGAVFVSKRGSSKRTRLGSTAVSLPLGSKIDATHGTARLTSTHNRSGSKLQTADFYDGAFTVGQNKASAPLTELTLAGGDFSGCAAAKRNGDVRAAASARRRLWGRGKGRFRTRGRNGTATVRGTNWLTEDLCEGTMATTRSGEVEANATDVELSRLLEPGQSVLYSCNTGGFTNSIGQQLSSLYCLVVLSQPADNLFGFGIATIGTQADSYGLCLLRPDQQIGCDTFPFGPEEGGIKAGGVGCFPATQGTYYVGWYLGDELLPVPLPFDSTKANEQPICVSSPQRPQDPVPSPKVRKLRAAARFGQ